MQTITLEMVKGNHISHTKKAEVTNNGITVIVHQFKNEPADVWAATSKYYKMIAKGLEINAAVKFANDFILNQN